jgi:hypothetical protein
MNGSYDLCYGDFAAASLCILAYNNLIMVQCGFACNPLGACRKKPDRFSPGGRICDDVVYMAADRSPDRGLDASE